MPFLFRFCSRRAAFRFSRFAASHFAARCLVNWRRHSGPHVVATPTGTNNFPQTAHGISAFAAFLSSFRLSGVVFAAFQAFDCSRSASLYFPAAHCGQYRCSPLLTMYSRPQLSHLSTLPRGRAAPALLCLVFCSRVRTFRHPGQYHARGPPGNTFPHCLHTRSRTVVFFRSATHSGQADEPGSPS